jgi:hypothetical protein
MNTISQPIAPIPSKGALHRQSAAKIGTVAGALIAFGFLYLLFYSAIEHNTLSIFATPLFGAIIVYAVIGLLLGVAAIVTAQLVREPVLNWIQLGIGLSVLSVLIAVSWESFVVSNIPAIFANATAQAMTQLSQMFQGKNLHPIVPTASLSSPGFMPIELFILYGINSGGWTSAFFLLLLSIASIDARRAVPGSVLIKIIGASVAGAALVSLLVQLLIWLAEPAGAVWIFIGGHDASGVISTIFMVFAQLAVLAILIVALIGSLSNSGNTIAGCAKWALGLTFGLICLTIGSDIIHFLLSMGTGAAGSGILAYITGNAAGVFPLGAAGLLTICGGKRTLVGFVAPSPQPTSAAAAGALPVPPAPQSAFPPPPPPPVKAPLFPAASDLAPSPQPGNAGTVEEQLIKYKGWHEQGLINEEEYRNMKLKALS